MKYIILKFAVLMVFVTQTLDAVDIINSFDVKGYQRVLHSETPVLLPNDTLEYSRYLDNIRDAVFFTRFCQHLLYEKRISSSLHSYLDDMERVKQILTLCLEVRQNENKYTDHYAFVTAQTSQYFAYQTIAKELLSTTTKTTHLAAA